MILKLLTTTAILLLLHSKQALGSQTSTKKAKKARPKNNICGSGTEFDQVLKQCVVKGFAYVPLPKCLPDNAKCFCDAYGYGTRGPTLGPHPDCNKYVSCDGLGKVARVMQCEPGFAYDEVAQVCFFKESVDCWRRNAKDIGKAIESKCLSEITPGDPICGCDTYIWNSATLVPDKCYGSDDVEFICSKPAVLKKNLEIGIGDGVRPGRAPDDFEEAALNTGLGYHDAPWLVNAVSNPDGEYPYKFDLDKTALIMIDFQRDFVCPGGFGETLGNDVVKLQTALQPARNLLKAARALGIPVIHTLESHKSDLSDLKDNKFSRGDLPPSLRIGQELGLGRILVRGSCGNNIVDMVSPKPGEHIIYKPGKTAFYQTELDELLQSLSIKYLIVAGVTTEVCMQSTVREATDRGYDPIIATDATRSYFERYRQQTIEQLVAQGALVAWAANHTAILKALESACIM